MLDSIFINININHDSDAPIYRSIVQHPDRPLYTTPKSKKDPYIPCSARLVCVHGMKSSATTSNPSHFYCQSNAESIHHLLATQVASEIIDVRIFSSGHPRDQTEARGKPKTSASKFFQTLPVPTN